MSVVIGSVSVRVRMPRVYLRTRKSTCVRISVVCNPICGSSCSSRQRQKKRRIAGENDDEDDKKKQTNLSRFCRYYSREGRQICPKHTLNIFFFHPHTHEYSLASEPRLDIHLTVLLSRIVLRAIIDLIKHS